MSRKSLIKSTGIIGAATAVSRILGFLRDIVIARFFGTAVYAQAFVVAFRIPNLLRDLIGEGATNSAFVPVLTEELTKSSRSEFFKLSRVLFNILFWASFVLTVLGIAASPMIVRMIAPGFIADTEKFQITVKLTRFLFPILMLIGLWAYSTAILNSLGYFAAPAFGPCLLNLSMILCAAWFGENVFGLTAGVLLGGGLQFLIQLPPLYGNGWRPVLTKEFSHPKVKRIGMLLIPRVLGTSVYQINVFVSTILASLSNIVGEGAVAALYFANRVWQLPLAVFGIALAQAMLPAMSKQMALNDMRKLKDTLSFSLNAIFFILVPASVGLMVLCGPITKVLFQRGAFTAYSTQITSSALFFYAIGLAACGGIKVLVSAFYSMHDTMTPVKTAVMAVILNIALNCLLMFPLKLGGLALASSISATFNFIALYILLERKIGNFGTRLVMDSFIRIVSASAVMALVLEIIILKFPNLTFTNLVITISAGVAAFVSASLAFRVSQLREFVTWILKRR